MRFLYWVNVMTCIACAVLPAWSEPKKFVLSRFLQDFLPYLLLGLTAHRDPPQSMASMFVTCSVMGADFLRQWVLSTANPQATDLPLIVNPIFEGLRWILILVGWMWSVVWLDNARQITRTFSFTAPLFIGIALVLIMQSAILASKHLQILQGVLRHTRMIALPASSTQLSFRSDIRQHLYTIRFSAPHQALKSWINRSPGTLTVTPWRQKNGAIQYDLIPNDHLEAGKVIIVAKFSQITLQARLAQSVQSLLLP